MVLMELETHHHLRLEGGGSVLGCSPGPSGEHQYGLGLRQSKHEAEKIRKSFALCQSEVVTLA